ncbi:AAWKG family protein [Streptomyces sp. NPDC058322]|uniref:AAWKG family protein n=1 Tax=Streptomyces sp. NPDC058322 TaxID=3346446 RepID=UPI0036EDEE9B
MSTPTSQNYDADDYWGQAVTKLTGYPMPSRKGLFTGLSSKEKSPLFRMSLDKISVQSVINAATQGSLKSDGQDYDLYFYSNKNGHVEMYHARLVFIGSFMSEKGRSRGLEANESLSGGKYKGKYGDDFDIGPLGQYMGGPGAALGALIDSKTTHGASFNGASVPDANVVDLNSFQRTAQAFDRAAQFFVDQAAVLAGWEKSLGSEQSAWKGQAAGIFWQLVHQLNGNYENYKEQLGAGDKFDAVGDPAFTPKSNHSKHLMAAQQTLLTQAKSLRTAWNAWMGRNEHDPHFHLIQVLDDILKWLTEHNIPFITSTTSTGNVINPTTTTTYSTKDGFQEPHPTYGDLTDIQNWAAVGNEAVKRWNDFIEQPHPDIEGLQAGLNGTAQTVLSDLNNNWIDATTPFDLPLTTKNTGSLTEFYTKEKTEKAKEEADKNNKDLNTTLENLNKGIGDMGNNVTKSLNDFGGGPGGLKDLLGGNTETKNLNGDSGNGLGGDTGKDLTSDLNKNIDDILNPGNGDSSQGNGDTTHTGPLNPTVPPPNLPNTSVLNPGGGTTSLDKNHNLVTTYPNGDRVTYDPKTGKYTVTPHQGKTTVQDLNPGQSVTNPDGSVTKLNKDGTLTTTFKDGSRQTVDPETGKVTSIDKNGKETVTDLNPKNEFQWPPKTNNHLTPPPTHQDLNHDLNRDLNRDLNHGLDRDLHRDLNSLGGNSHTSLNNSSSGGGQNRSGNGDYEEYDSTFHPGGTLGAPPGATGNQPPASLPDTGIGTGSGSGPSSDGSTPLNPMMPMGGMGGMGGMGAGGQAGGSSGERVRNVLTESGPGTRGGSSRSGGRRGADEERNARRARTATSSTAVAGGAAGGTQGGQATGSGERDRVHWVAEDEDVWGAEEGGTPTVIGR